MQLARLLTPEGPVAGEHVDGVVSADAGDYEVGVDGRLLPPCEPSAIYCVGSNFAESSAADRPAQPDFFIKPPASLLAHGRPIRYPSFTEDLRYAGELAAVIDRRCRDLAPEDVPAAVRGYTVMNDLDAYDQPGRTARKAFDGSAPLGPFVETDVDPTAVDFAVGVNGEERVASSTGRMHFDAREVVAFLSRRVTLRPGDVVALGSPGTPGTIEPGDVVEVTYEGVGTLRNEVVAAGG